MPVSHPPHPSGHMKNLHRALAFSAVLLLAAGCPKKGAEPERTDASLTPSTGSAEQTVPQEVQDAGVPQAAATGEDDGGTTFERTDELSAADAGTRGTSAAVKGAAQHATRDAGTGAGSAADAGGGTSPGAASAREACVDRWLASQKLDRYGSKQGTMYAGGSPLFDERTGETTDRLTYVFARHPAAQQACPQ
jgi:hypothetical protein